MLLAKCEKTFFLLFLFYIFILYFLALPSLNLLLHSHSNLKSPSSSLSIVQFNTLRGKQAAHIKISQLSVLQGRNQKKKNHLVDIIRLIFKALKPKKTQHISQDLCCTCKICWRFLFTVDLTVSAMSENGHLNWEGPGNFDTNLLNWLVYLEKG